MGAKMRRIEWILVAVAAIGLLFAAGCGSTKMTAKATGEKIFAAEKAVSAARDGNASENAKTELGVAEEKLAKAKDKFAKEKFDEASRLADLTIVDAEYAGVKATAQKNQNMVGDLKKGNDALRQEIKQMSQ